MTNPKQYHMTPMATKNEHTGDVIQTKTSTKAYDEGYERIFGKPEKKKPKDDSWAWRPEDEDERDKQG